jgi:pantoate--beta-alanine ligase
MKIILDSIELKKELGNNHNLGFVPTMGGIHEGHKYLISRSKKECNKTLVSIFVNPTQFDNKNDLKKYPRNIKKDLLILKRLKVDYVFIPKFNDIYSYKRRKKIRLKKKELILCAKFRKGHFEGVLDVMDRLTKLVHPNKIFMGEKDYQQYYLVKNFLKKKHKTKVIKCKTFRSLDNVALSTRNLLLNKKDLKTAGKIISELIKFKKTVIKVNLFNQYLDFKKKDLIKKYKIKIDYLEIRKIKDLKETRSFKKSKIFISYYLNKIRLIDNL